MDKKNQEFDVLIFFQDNLMGELYSTLINYMTGFECITVSSVGNAEKILKDSQKQQLDQELKNQRKPDKKVEVKKSTEKKTKPIPVKTKSSTKKTKKVSKK